jgi:hypothetical protein
MEEIVNAVRRSWIVELVDNWEGRKEGTHPSSRPYFWHVTSDFSVSPFRGGI